MIELSLILVCRAKHTRSKPAISVGKSAAKTHRTISSVAKPTSRNGVSRVTSVNRMTKNTVVTS